MNRFLFAAAVAAAALTAAPAHASAGSPATTQLTVSAIVAPACAVSATSFKIGDLAYDPNAAGVTRGSTDISFVCTKGTPIAFRIVSSANTTAGQHRLVNAGGEFLTYTLESAPGTPWADVTTGYSGTGLQQTKTVYAAIDPGQYKPVDTYADTMTVNVEF